MKADGRPDTGGGPERDELRAILRQWRVPEAPPEIEDQLRLSFRRRRSPRRRALWISLAAGLTMLAAWQMRPPDRPSRPAWPQAPVAAVPSLAEPLRTVEPHRVSGSTPAVAEQGRVRLRPVAAPKEPEVVVEPDQAALLAELVRTWSGTRQAAPGTAIPQMPEVEVPRYLEEWQTVPGEWPLVQQSDAMGGR